MFDSFKKKYNSNWTLLTKPSESDLDEQEEL